MDESANKAAEVATALRHCLLNVTTASINTRKELFNQKLVQTVTNEAFQEAQLKGVSKIVMLTLLRYNDSLSRSLVQNFITKLLEKYGLVMAKFLLVEIHGMASSMAKTPGSLFHASSAITLLKWCSQIWKVYLPKKSEDESLLKPLIEIEILCYSVVCAVNSPKLKKLKMKARNCLNRHKKLDDIMNYINVMMKNEKNQIQCLYMLDYIYYYLQLHKAIASITAEMKKSFIDMFIKNCIQTKVAAPKSCLVHVAGFLKYMTHDDFAEILPIMQKSLLRNPETILQAVGHVLAGLSIDLSRYIDDLSSCVCTHLVSQNANLRADAVFAIESIVKQCSDASALEVIVKHVLKILGGAEGKLALPEQRISVLLAITGTSKATLSSTHMESLANIVFTSLFPFILQEGNEGALIQALTTMKIWCKYFVANLPSDFIDSIKKGVSAKNCAAVVRANYYQVASEAIKGNTLLKGLPLLDSLLQTVEKAKTQTHMVNNVYEAIVASSLICRMASLDDVPENKFDTFWATILDQSKKVLVGEKILATDQPEHLQQLANLLNILFISHPDRVLKKGLQIWYPAFKVTLLHGDHNTRTQVRGLLSKIIGAADFKTIEFQQKMFNELKQAVETYEANQISDTKCIPLSRIVSTYHFIATCGQKDEQQAYETLMSCLVDVNHPALQSESDTIFSDMASALNVDAKKFITDNKEKLVNLFVDEDKLEKMHFNTLHILLSISPEELLTLFMKYLRESLSNHSFVNVTSDEIGIMNTPDGEAYNQSVYESAKAANQKDVNVKRESKAYSYKEQKIEMELREELKKKKAPQGEQEKKPELNQKQKEQLQIILNEEKEIRTKLKGLDQELLKTSTILNACLDVDATHLKFYFLDLLSMLLPLCSSLLAASHVIPAYLKLSQCICRGELKHIGLFIANVILRCRKAPYTLPPGWAEEDSKAQMKRALSILHTFVTERNVYMMMAYSRKKPFSAPAFAMFLPFLKIILKDRGAALGKSETYRMNALQIIMAHSKLRANSSDVLDEYGPELLPCSEMLQVLSEVIIGCDGNNKDGKIQQYANTVFDEVCKAASGEIGCTMATNTEIELLLGNVFSPCTVLRNASLKGLLEIINILPTADDPSWDDMARRVMIARYDENEKNAELAESLWVQSSLSVSPQMTRDIARNVTHPLVDIRLAACKGLATCLEQHPDASDEIFTSLLETYQEKTKIPPPIIDNLGRVVSANYVDPWESRQGIGLALEKCVEFATEDMLETLFRFFVPTALGDCEEKVRKQMLDAAMQYVNTYGEAHMSSLLKIFDEFLDKAPDSSAHDTIRQSVIILTGSLAKHLEKTDPKIKPIFSKLMGALATPSQPVQQAVAECLPPLCAAMKTEAPDLIKDLLEQLLESESYGERRGAAYGLAGLVKGLGILTLKQQNIISTLNESIQDKKNWKHREGALFAFETLCTMLGRLFEPYVVHLLPHLLLCFGDGNQYVREAADETAKAVMRNLSNHGVKLVLPSLLKALEEESWRTKTGSAELLGAMSFCAPKQLSSCLPSIVPKLTEVLADSHIKVQKAGQQALRQIGGVIKNPEIQEISSIILDALADPNKNVVACLEGLLSTSFVHFIDAPSLALIMPTLERALELRATETKKMAAQILGNMYALTDPKDLSPYLPAVVPGLKKSLLDPSPEVRAVSSRALGATVKGMGQECFDELMPWLLETLTSEVSSVDRSGAAQGLSEVLHALGQERLDNLMPEVIQTTMKTDLAPNVRDGYLMLYIYLPATFGDDFMEYIGPIVPSILKGLADESEYVRDTSLKAGQRIISMYSDSAIELLLPQLEAGLFDEHWRIRYSSVQLLGDLLFRLSGVTGKQTTVGDEDDNFGTAHSAQIILETLGSERRDRVYAGLYMGRSDVALAVRQAALHVWKVIVQNTAKTLREILPVLFELLLGCLASKNYDKRQVAARSLGDLVRKLGERILPEIIPILEAGLLHEDGDKRQGVCIGLSEIMDSTSRDMITQFEESLITTVRKALIDVCPDVRHAAALTFENLHNTIGHRALDGVLPNVFEQLENPELSELALDGLKQVMAVKSKSVLPFLIPKLTTPPVNTKALAILSSVAGEALVKHLEKILPAMFQAINTETDGSDLAFDGTKTLILSVEDDTGVHMIIDELISASKDKNPGIRKVSANMLAMFCKESKGEYLQYVQQLFRCIIQLMNDVDVDVYTGGWEALDALVKHLDPSEQLQHLNSLKQAIKFIKEEVRNGQLPGFCIPKKGIIPILPIFREGILNGPQEVKEQTAAILGEIIKLTSPEALKPSVVHITGPLIRILGDRFNWTVKVAILDTLGLLLEKVGIMLKPFLPQLQTTFVKALNDPTLAVRAKASWALGLLIVLHTRVDSLFTELKNGVKNTEDNAIRETILQALRTIILKAGAKMGEPIRAGLLEVLQEFLDYPEDGVRVFAGGALGAMCSILSDDELKELLTSALLDVNPSIDWTACHGRAVALSYALFDAPSKLFNTVGEDEIVKVVVDHSMNDRVPVCTYGVHSLGHLLMFSKENPEAAPASVITSMKKNLIHSSNDVKLAALRTLKYMAKNRPDVMEFDTVQHVIPEFKALLRDRNTAVRSAAELTLAFVLQLDKNELLFDECLSSIPEVSSSYLNEYKKMAFEKISDSLSADPEDYVFVT